MTVVENIMWTFCFLSESHVCSYPHPLFSDVPIPDPVKLLQRLDALESRMEQLRRDCIEVPDGRNEMIALAITNAHADNAHLLQQVSSLSC